MKDKPVDIGAYESGCTNYWIPGFEDVHASKPIPADGATNAKPDTDLIWLHGWQSELAHVYLGTDMNAVAEATPESPQFVGELRGNIVTPKKKPKEAITCYWRVDAIDRNGNVIKGEVSSFAVER